MFISVFKRVTTLALLFSVLVSNLTAYPVSHTRFFNEQTGQTLDLIGDAHRPNDFVVHKATCDSLLGTLKMLDPAKTSFIWEYPHAEFFKEMGITEEDYVSLVHCFMINAGFSLKKRVPLSFGASDLRDVFLRSFFAVAYGASLSEAVCNELKDITLESGLMSGLLPISRIFFADFSFNNYPRLSREAQEILTKEKDSYKKGMQKFFIEQKAMLNKTFPDFFSSTEFSQEQVNTFMEKVEGLFMIKVLDFSILMNIFSSDKQHIIVYAGVAHCENIAHSLRSGNSGFTFVFGGFEKEIIDELEKVNVTGLKLLDESGHPNPILFQNIKPLPAGQWKMLL